MYERIATTMHRRNGRFHVLYDDFLDICAKDIVNASALRVCEVKHDQLVARLIDRHNIVEGHLPHEDDLWFDLSVRDVEYWSLKVRGKSSYARALASHNADKKVTSLVQLGYVSRRVVARPGYGDDPVRRPPRPTQRDGEGVYLVVDAENGEYEVDGVLYHTQEQGYSRLCVQYRYNLDAINAAIAAYDGDDRPPRPLPRWKPLYSGSSQEEGRGEAHETTIHGGQAPNGAGSGASQGGSSRMAGQSASFTNENITHVSGASSSVATSAHTQRGVLTPSGVGQQRPASDGGVQRGTAASNGARSLSKISHNKKERSKKKESLSTVKKDSASPLSLSDEDFERLRTAPWNAETLIGLLSKVLYVPALSEISQETWQAECAEPAERLLAAAARLTPDDAWQKLDRTSRYMTQANSPSWWVRPVEQGGRTTKTQVTLRNLADNLDLQYGDCCKQQWFPSETTVYGADAHIWQSTPRRPKRAGMPRVDCDKLVQEMQAQHPQLQLGYKAFDGDGARGVICFLNGNGEWQEVAGYTEWMCVSQSEIEAAIAYVVATQQQQHEEQYGTVPSEAVLVE